MRLQVLQESHSYLHKLGCQYGACGYWLLLGSLGSRSKGKKWLVMNGLGQTTHEEATLQLNGLMGCATVGTRPISTGYVFIVVLRMQEN